jgi:phage terminase small subunit
MAKNSGRAPGATLKNAKHEAVLRHYISSQARIGWKSYAAIYSKSSQHAAEVAWSRLLKNAEFAARLSELDKAVAERVVEKTAITKEAVLAELALIGFANMQDYAVIFPDGDVSTISREHAAAVQEIVVDTYMDGHGDDAREVKRVRFKLGDKRAALVDIGRELGMFKNKHEHGGEGGGPIKFEDETERPGELEIARRIAFALERAGRCLTASAPKQDKSEKKGKRK